VDDNGHLTDVDYGYIDMFQGEGPLGAGTRDYTTYGGRVYDFGKAVVGEHELQCRVQAWQGTSRDDYVPSTQIYTTSVSARYTGLCIKPDSGQSVPAMRCRAAGLRMSFPSGGRVAEAHVGPHGQWCTARASRAHNVTTRR
jgi:hypothetical protein